MTDAPRAPSSSFDGLPTEVLRSILSYADVPSLAALSNSHRPRDGNVSELAADDVTWYSLVRNRFGIGRDDRRRRLRGRRRGPKEGEEAEGVVVVNGRGGDPSSSADGGVRDGRGRRRLRRPTSYGGRDWKSAYRSLSSTMRVPDTRLTSGAVFASPGKKRASGSGGGGGGRGCVADCLGVWCMVNHAENCRTRTVVDGRATGFGGGGAGRRRRRRPSGRRGGGRGTDDDEDPPAPPPPLLPYRSDRRYIELRICLQNTKSGYGRIVVPDVGSIRISSYDEDNEEDEEDVKEDEEANLDDPHSHRGDVRTQGRGCRESTFAIVVEGPWAPRIALRRRANLDDDDGCRRDDAAGDGGDAPAAAAAAAEYYYDYYDDDFDGATATTTSVILRPFEVVVLSVHVSCPECHAYETDALSSMSSVRVPIAADGWPKGCRRGGGGGGDDDDNDNEYNGNGRSRRRDVSIARFLPEDDLWKYYCLLPGGCMSLTDRSRLVPM
ncbi:hypothetical protein ACHAW5_005180 [Stephanodiscus triporus]|uniref:F-box domain-containing protein n=1 Tax=Stephanodiscus triporus TaxID=2934178 RepID=A0ABD3MGH0_9STRA